MATENTATTAAPARKIPTEIKIVSHSPLFYWWPVWAVGFLMGIISYMPPQFHLLPVPTGTKAGFLAEPARIQLASDPDMSQEVSEETPVWFAKKGTPADRVHEPGVTVSSSSKPGVFFVFILLLVIAITNIHLRGLWSLVVIVVIVALIVILTLVNAWEYIIYYFRVLDIRISTGGYFVFSSILFAIWLVVFLLFDPQRYMIFTPGQFKVRLEIGEGETSYDTRGMTVKKERSDFFKHWILGLGSGDLIVNTTGAQAHHFDLPNVLFLNRRLRMIADMVRAHKVEAKV